MIVAMSGESDDGNAWDDSDDESATAPSAPAIPAKSKKFGSGAATSPKRGPALSPKQRKKWKKLHMTEKAASNKSAGGSAAGRTRANSPPNDKKVCLACDENRYRKLRWCLLHRRGYDCARGQEEAKGPEALKKFVQKMATDAGAAEAIKCWCKHNPCSTSGGKK